MVISDDDKEQPARRIVYVLTIWHEDESAEKGRRTWRMHLVDPISEEECGFTQLEELFQFIKAQLEKAE